MQRSALLIGAGIIAALISACIPQPSDTGPGPKAELGRVMALDACSSSADFATNKVKIIDFDPTTNPGDPVSSVSAGGSGYAVDLNAAFALAPQSFKEQLCGLDGVFINTHGCSAQNCTSADPVANSWGLRESTTRNPSTGGTYIALSAALWGAGNPASSHHALENYIFESLLDWHGSGRPAYQSIGSSPSYSRGMAILAALAHEFGHVLWFVTNNFDRAPTYDPSGFCSSNFFVGWNTIAAQNPSFIEFATVKGTHLFEPQIWQIQNMLPGNPAGANDAIDTFYEPDAQNAPGSGSPWASLFATFSPEEDFVETFKMAVLLNATTPMTSQPITFPLIGNIRQDIPATLSQRAALTAKLSCFNVH